MESNGNQLFFAAGLNSDQMQIDAQKTKDIFKGIGNVAESEGSRIDTVFKRVGQSIAAIASIDFAARIGSEIIQVRGQFQQLQVAFETMLQSKVKADTLISEVVKFAATTPYTLIDIAGATKQLLAFGFQANAIIPTLRMVGDVASGIGAPISDIVYLYGRLQTQGQLYSRDMMEFTRHGIPLIGELAKVYGITTDKVKSLVEAGKVGFPEVEKAFQAMAGEGGKFYNLMAKQNLTITGQISNLKDNLDEMFNSIGKNNEGIIYGGISGLNSLVKNYEGVLATLKGLVLMYGAYKAASMAVTAVENMKAATLTRNAAIEQIYQTIVAGSNIQMAAKARGIASEIILDEARVAATRNVAAAEAELSAAQKTSMLTNPYVIGAVLITGALYAGYKYLTYQTELQKAIANNSVEVENEKDKINDLFMTLKDAEQGTQAFTNAKKALINAYGEYIPQQLQEFRNLGDIELAQIRVNQAMQDAITLKTKNELIGTVTNDYNTTIQGDKTKVYDRIKDQSGGAAAASARRDLDQMITQFKTGKITADQLDEASIKLMQHLGVLNEKGTAASMWTTNIIAPIGEIIRAVKNLKIELSEIDKGLSTSGTINTPDSKPGALVTIEKRIADAKKQLEDEKAKLNKMRLPSSTATDKQITDSEDNVKLLETNLALLTGETEKKQKADAEKAEKALDERNKAVEELNRKHLQNMEEFASSEAGISAGRIASMEDSLQKEKLQHQLEYDTRIKAIEREKKATLEELNKSLGVKPGSKNEVKDLTDSRVSDTAFKDDANKRALALADLNAKDEGSVRDWGEKAKQIYRDVTEYRLTGIQKEMAAIDEKFDKELKAAKGTVEYSKLQPDIETARAHAKTEAGIKWGAEELDFQQQLETQKNELTANGFNRDAQLQELNFQTFVKYQKAKIAILAASTDPEQQKQAKVMQAALDTAINNQGLTKEKQLRQDILNISNQAIEGLRNYNAELANSLTLLLSAEQAIQKAFSKEGLTKAEVIGDAISGTISLVSMAINQASQNKQIMDAYYTSVIKQQNDYNLALNEQLRLNSEIKGTVFIKDYEATLEDATKSYNDAQKNYQDQLTKFAAGQAITGKKDVVSGTNVLSGVGAGALTGAAIGSVVPVIGTAIGAAIGGMIGGLTGLFAKKKKDIVKPLLDIYPELIQKDGEFNEALAKTLIANKQVTDATAATLQNMIDWKDAADAARKQITDTITTLAGSLGDDLRNALVTAFEDGTSAAQAFGDSVDKVVENIVSNLLFNKVFGPALQSLQDEMNASYGIGPNGTTITGPQVDNSWTDDLTRFFQKLPGLSAQFDSALADAKAAAGANGETIFSSGSRTPVTGAITSMSQDSADKMSGIFTEIQSLTYDINQSMNAIRDNSGAALLHLAGIETNTARLEAIENDIGSIEDGIGSIKNGIDTINLKGILLKK